MQKRKWSTKDADVGVDADAGGDAEAEEVVDAELTYLGM